MLLRSQQMIMRLVLFIGLLIFPVFSTLAQDVTVPDVTGLNLPQAAARLNENGLRLGEQTAEPWTSASSGIPGSVVNQSVAAGIMVAQGSSVDLTILSDSRITLIYDDNDLTLINRAGANINLNGLMFSSDDGTRRFNASNWRNNLDDGDCTQIWSIARNQPKQVDGCDSIFWQTTNETSNHFWTQTAGVSQFNVIQDGDVLATCDAALPNSQDSPTSCEFYVVTSATGSASTDYVYFSYTIDRLVVINNTTDRWMPLNNTPIFNFNPQISNPGVQLILGNPDLFPNVDTVADIRRLAPGQCLMLTLSPLTNAEPTESCNVIAQRDLSAEVIFWAAPFELLSPFSDSGRASCPAAVEDKLTRCYMPR